MRIKLVIDTVIPFHAQGTLSGSNRFHCGPPLPLLGVLESKHSHSRVYSVHSHVAMGMRVLAHDLRPYKVPDPHPTSSQAQQLATRSSAHPHHPQTSQMPEDSTE